MILRSALCGLCCAIILAVIAQAAAAADNQRLSVQFTPLSPRARHSAPIPGVWELTSTGSELLEGRLDVLMQVGEVKQRLVIPDIVVTPGEPNRFRGLLPSLEIPSYGNQDIIQVNLFLQFVPATGPAFRREMQPLMFPSPNRQSFVLGVCDPGMLGGGSIDQKYTVGLAFEQFNPRKNDHSLNTLPAHIAPRDFPIEPFGYCAFDIVILADESVMELDTKQLTAIAKWVRAGGSLCLLPATAVDEQHLRFLNEMTTDAGSDLIFVSDEQGRPSASGAAEDEQYALLRVGLGRVAIGLSPERKSHDIKSKPWREMAAFLWKINGQNIQSIAESGVLFGAALARDEEGISEVMIIGEGPFDDFDSEMYIQNTPLAEELASTKTSMWTIHFIGQLMPEEFRIVPLWLIGGLLLLFVLVIGPVDYYLLGALKMRKFTWIFFPLTAFAFAYATVWTANVYMGETNETHAYQILDIGGGGEILRANRFELHFNGVAKHIETDVSGGLFNSLNTSNWRYSAYSAEEEGDLSVLQGRLPQQLTVIQDIPQWTPRLSRQSWIAPGKKIEPPTTFDWDAVQISDLESISKHPDLTARLLAAFGKECSIYVMNQGQFTTLATNRKLMINPHVGLMQNQYRYPYQQTASRQTGVGQPIAYGHVPQNFNGDQLFRHLSARPATGLFSVVSQISPGGSWSFDDLAILDPSDPGQWLLMVAQPHGDDVVIYRKLYRRADTTKPLKMSK